ncbi:MAG: aminotransferase class IV [Lewinellaceae bacterium]|nr:aminotransferase class IV [Saprospiraceae bacterium]MCB9338379.1 aminotransferase class IV [Lewinellaceae bacterium]
MIKYYSINGELVPKEEATLGVTDLAIQRGYGLFDYFLVKKGQPLFFEDYLDRLERSSALMRLQLPFSREEIKHQIMQLIRANGMQEAGMKLILTGGYSPDGYAPAQPNLIILQSPLPVYPKTKYEEGVKLMLFEYHRTLPSAKSINYLIGVNLLPEMQAAGAEDILFHANGNIYETTRANFFIVKNDNTIVTAGSGVLMGITRLKTVELAKRHFNIEEREVKLTELETAKEAFLTSSTKGIMPVVRVDDLVVGDGKPGAVTKRLAGLLEEEVERIP